VAKAHHSPKDLWENPTTEEADYGRSDEEIALDITRGMALWKDKLKNG
jgi:hypothetical protein